MQFKIDQKFIKYFRNLKQVFMYVTNECNLRCVHCYCKPDLIFHLREKEIEINTALALISDFKEMGATKLTIIGGEPTLYGVSQEWKPLFILIKKAKRLGYEYIRLDTNGQFEESFLEKEDIKLLDEITFSLDGPSPSINDSVRGAGTFEKCVKNIKKAIEFHYPVNITCCLHRGLVKKDSDGRLPIDSMILFAESLGISRINFHDLIKTGTPRDCWTNKIDISLKEWANVRGEIQKNIEAGKYKIPVRIPQCFIEKEAFNQNSRYYGYCPAKIGERVLVHPNGIIRICPLLIGTPYGIARFYKEKIVWDESSTNELYGYKLDQDTPCANQNKGTYLGNFIHLCVSFKPKQKEFIWEKKLQWERKRKQLFQ